MWMSVDCDCMEFAAAGWYIGKYQSFVRTIRDLLPVIGKSCGIGTGSNGFEKGQVRFVSGSCSREREEKKGFKVA